MPYKPLEIDRQNMTIMGISFPDLKTLERVSNALGSNMFEGFEPTPKLIEIYRDYSEGKIRPANLIETLKGAL